MALACAGAIACEHSPVRRLGPGKLLGRLPTMLYVCVTAAGAFGLR